MGSSFRLVRHSLTPVRPFLNALPPFLEHGLRHAMVGEMHRAVPTLSRKAPVLLFVAALMLAAFAGGLYVAKYEVFPYALLSNAYKTFVAAVQVTHPPSPQRAGISWTSLPTRLPPGASSSSTTIA